MLDLNYALYGYSGCELGLPTVHGGASANIVLDAQMYKVCMSKDTNRPDFAQIEQVRHQDQLQQCQVHRSNGV